MIKIVLFLFFARQLWIEYLQQNPCSSVAELIYRNNQWSLQLKNGQVDTCDEIQVVIHNTLFQLIRCSILKKNKVLILFNDQIPEQQLALLHLLTAHK